MINTAKLNLELIDACRNEDLKKVKHFIQRGACLSMISKSLFFILSSNKKIEIAKYLVEEQQFNIHEKREKLLQTAIRLENYNLINFLIDKKANFSLDDVLDEVVRSKNMNMIIHLINKGLAQEEIDMKISQFKEKGYKLKIEEDWNKYKELKTLNIKITEEFDFFEQEGLVIAKQTKKQKI